MLKLSPKSSVSINFFDSLSRVKSAVGSVALLTAVATTGALLSSPQAFAGDLGLQCSLVVSKLSSASPTPTRIYSSGFKSVPPSPEGLLMSAEGFRFSINLEKICESAEICSDAYQVTGNLSIQQSWGEGGSGFGLPESDSFNEPILPEHIGQVIQFDLINLNRQTSATAVCEII